MYPIRPINRNDDSIAAVTRVADARVKRETPDEAHERRQREQREKARKQAARAWADSQLRRLEVQHEQTLVGEDESDDGHAHCDIRV
jgi:hypothetical protein